MALCSWSSYFLSKTCQKTPYTMDSGRERTRAKYLPIFPSNNFGFLKNFFEERAESNLKTSVHENIWHFCEVVEKYFIYCWNTTSIKGKDVKTKDGHMAEREYITDFSKQLIHALITWALPPTSVLPTDMKVSVKVH